MSVLICCCWYHKGTNFQANHNRDEKFDNLLSVVADTTKVRIFKQITTEEHHPRYLEMLLLIPQRYEFSSKSQLTRISVYHTSSCCWYHKGTNFQANHNLSITCLLLIDVVADTTKVRIFKQITTIKVLELCITLLLLIPQRYEFSSKSQHKSNYLCNIISCCWYHKGTNFQANHNKGLGFSLDLLVVADTTKVRIFKQITTPIHRIAKVTTLLLIPQRYEFSSKSQQGEKVKFHTSRCCWYHKGTNFQANHNTEQLYWKLY